MYTGRTLHSAGNIALKFANFAVRLRGMNVLAISRERLQYLCSRHVWQKKDSAFVYGFKLLRVFGFLITAI